MEWLKQLLKAQGLSDEQITAIMGGVETNYKGWVPEHRFKEVNDAKKAAEDSLKDRDKQLDELKKSAGSNEDLKKQIETLQDEHKTTKEKYESDLKELRLNTAIKLAVSGDAHDPDLVVGLVDKSKLILSDDGKVSGLDDQLKALQTSKAFLFVEKQDGSPQTPQFKGVKPPDGNGNGNNTGGQKNPWKIGNEFNLTEQGRILRENPDLAKQLQAAARQ